ncbi:BTB/POZ domain-containing protein 2 isoform X1 [Ctenopharyngodon idella]|uniref:BTB/POZ domain-containing protein 2 isoform X1 n=1 Tax=Ctenopharyngodon idella TaxID=7959 RepID=UPI00222E7B23|nr:BTB/POZ domain-containing protein 2 isoform X1 [Ctenopharyngodon idella]
MATGDNSGRVPCLNFSGHGPLGNSQPSNSPYALAASHGGSVGGGGGSHGVTRRSNPQTGPAGLESPGVASGPPPNLMNSLPAAAAVMGPLGGAMAPTASNMTGSPSNAVMTPAAATHSSLSTAPAAAAVLVYREPVYNWQATKSTVKERFAFLFNNEVLSDVHFLVGKGMGVQRIPAHRFVLAAGSAVFDAMFNGGMATTSTEIELPDVEAAAFLSLLKFLYSDEVQIGPETVMTTLYTAKKYAVPALEAHCVEFLKKNLRADNAFMLLTQARLFDEPQLASLCLENIDKNTGDALAAEGFTDIDIGPAQSAILTDREVVSLFLHFTVNPKPRVEFIDRPRCCLRGKECSITRFGQVESRWGYSGTSDRIRFSVSRRIFIVGFGLYGSIHGPTDYQVNIQIIHTDSNTVLGQNDTGFSCDGSANTFRVMFKEPVEVLPNVNYTACATLKGPDSHYGTKGMRKVTHESSGTGTKTCFTFCYAAGNNNGTSVEDGQIPEVIFYT